MKGKLVGFNHVSGKKKDGSEFDFVVAFFEIPTPDTGKGVNFESYRSYDEKLIKQVCSVSKFPVRCYYSTNNNYLSDVDLLES